MNITEIIMICSCIFIFSLIFTRYIIIFAKAKNIVDIPNDRSSHAVTTPRGGGLSISLSLITCLLFIITTHNNIPNYFLLFTFCIVVISIIGIIDDLKGLSIKIRGLIYVLISSVFITVVLNNNSNEIYFAFLLIIFLTWFINMYNFMDGADGISSIQAITCALPVGVIFSIINQNTLALFCYSMAASSVGFLIWNWPQAKIFMGDVGSCVIGFVFGCLMIVTYLFDYFSLYIWFILLSFFIVDSLLTLIMRILTREKWYMAHRSHSYQRILQIGFTHTRLASIFIIYTLLIQWPAVFIVYRMPEIGVYITSAIYIILVYVWYVVQKKYKRTAC